MGRPDVEQEDHQTPRANPPVTFSIHVAQGTCRCGTARGHPPPGQAAECAASGDDQQDVPPFPHDLGNLSACRPRSRHGHIGVEGKLDSVVAAEFPPSTNFLDPTWLAVTRDDQAESQRGGRADPGPGSARHVLSLRPGCRHAELLP